MNYSDTCTDKGRVALNVTRGVCRQTPSLNSGVRQSTCFFFRNVLSCSSQPSTKAGTRLYATKFLLRYAREGEFANKILLVFGSHFTRVLPKNPYRGTENFLECYNTDVMKCRRPDVTSQLCPWPDESLQSSHFISHWLVYPISNMRRVIYCLQSSRHS